MALSYPKQQREMPRQAIPLRKDIRLLEFENPINMKSPKNYGLLFFIKLL